MHVRLGGFTFQVRVVLALVVLFLAALDLVNLALLRQARSSIESAERERAEAVSNRAASAVGLERLTKAATARERGAASAVDEALRRGASRSGLRALTLLDAAGRRVAGTAIGGGSASVLADLSAREQDGLRSGRVVTGGMEPPGGGEQAQIAVYVPLADEGGRLAGIVRAVLAVPELGRFETSFRLVLAIQVAGVLLILGLAILFANWVSRPYRRLAVAAGEAGIAGQGQREEAEPDDLAQAFRAVVEKLKAQEEALGTLGREGGGLGDLVRFASGPARSMTTGVLVLDRQARFAACNPAARAHLGLRAAELGEATLQQVAGGIEGLSSLVRACLEQGKGASREVLPIRAADGRAGHIGVAISPAFGWGGEAVGALVLTTDLTEIRRLQEQTRLREGLATVGELSAGIAHEFRNALGTILGWARMLEKEADPRVREPAREIVREVDSVRSAVDEFLLYARPPEPSRSTVDLEAVARAAAAAAPEGAEVEVEGEFGAILGDEGLLRRALGNLIQNAFEAARDAGREVRVGIRGRSAAAGRTIQVEVDDDGPGIPPERRAQVFVPFYTTRARGTGLGLALVQRTVIDLGGSVEVADGPRGGALFRLRFPAAPRGESAPA